MPRADRKRIGELFQSRPQDFVRIATVDNYYTAFIGNRRNFRQTVDAGYSQLDVSPLSGWTLRGGLRLERTENRLVNTTRACAAKWSPPVSPSPPPAGPRRFRASTTSISASPALCAQVTT